jgi:RNA polymerase sigma-70 factor (ECF subfamily)
MNASSPPSEGLEAQIAAHLEAENLQAAAAAMIRGYGPEILSYLAGVSRDAALADEVFSTFAEDLWRGLPGFRRESSVRTWLYRLAYNAFQRHRQDPFRKRQIGLSRHLEGVAAEVRSRTAPFLRTEFKSAIARLREQLDPDEQTLLVLRVDRRLSWREVSEVMTEDVSPDGLRLSEATLTKRFERLRSKLRLLAQKEGLLPDE